MAFDFASASRLAARAHVGRAAVEAPARPTFVDTETGTTPP
jgi:hypothetical protein